MASTRDDKTTSKLFKMLESTTKVLSDKELSVNANFVHVIEYGAVSSEKIATVSREKTFKVLKILNCPSIDEILNKFREETFTKSLKETSHLFVIIIQTDKKPTQVTSEKLSVLNFDDERPLIIQFESNEIEEKVLFCKDELSTKFKQIVINRDAKGSCNSEQRSSRMKRFRNVVFNCFGLTPNGHSFSELKMTRKNDCNLSALLDDLSQIYGKFNGDILDTKLNKNVSNGLLKFVANYNVLCTRFLRLFDDGEIQSVNALPLVESFHYSGVQNLLAYMDFSFKSKNVVIEHLDRHKLKDESSNEITENDEIAFISSLWRTQFGELHHNYEEVAQHSMSQIKDVFPRDEDDLVNGISLRLRLVAASFNDIFKDPNQVDFTIIYERFITATISNWENITENDGLEELKTENDDSTDSELRCRELTDHHREIASLLIVNEPDESFSKIWHREKFAELGLVKFPEIEGKDWMSGASFIHRSLMEFLVAKRVVACFAESIVTDDVISFYGFQFSRLENYSSMSFLVKGLGDEICPGFGFFMDKFLTTCLDDISQELLEEIADFFESSQLIFNRRKAITSAFEKGHKALEQLFLKFFIYTSEEFYYSISFLSLELKCKTAIKITTPLSLKLTHGQKKFLILNRNKNGEDLLCLILKRRDDPNASLQLLKKMKEILTLEEQKKVLTNENVLHLAALENYSEDVMKSLLEMIKSVLTVDEQKKLLNSLDTEDCSPMFRAFCKNTKAVVTVLFNFIRDAMTVEEQRQMMQKKAMFGHNIYQVVATNSKNLMTLNDAMKNIFSEEEIKAMLRESCIIGTTVWHRALLSLEHNNTVEFIKFTKEVFTVKEQKELLTVYDGKLSSAIMVAVSANRSVADLHSFWQYLLDLFTTDELKSLTMKSMFRGINAILMGCAIGYIDVFRAFCSIVINFLSPQEQKSMFRKCDEMGNNFILYCMFLRNKDDGNEVLNMLLGITRNVFTKSEMRQVFNQTNNNGESFSSIVENSEEILNLFYPNISPQGG